MLPAKRVLPNNPVYLNNDVSEMADFDAGIFWRGNVTEIEMLFEERDRDVKNLPGMDPWIRIRCGLYMSNSGKHFHSSMNFKVEIASVRGTKRGLN
jgi:hypothetical protein